MEKGINSLAIAPKRVAMIGVVDLLWLVAIYYLPTLSHLCKIPFYILEPMRIALFTTLVLTNNKTNTYILALTLPLFSFFVGGHPVFLKSLMMAGELLINVWLFWRLTDKNVNHAVSAFLSIAISKSIYYVVKYFVVSIGLLKMSMISTPLWIQVIVALVLSSLFLLRRNSMQQ